MVKNAGDIIYAGQIPGEVMASSSRTSSPSTFTTSETQLDSVTANLITGHIYKVCYHMRISSSIADGRVLVVVRQDNISGGIITSGRVHTVGMVAGQNAPISMETFFTAASTGAKTFVGTGVRESGTGNITASAASTSPALLYVEYVGT